MVIRHKFFSHLKNPFEYAMASLDKEGWFLCNVNAPFFKIVTKGAWLLSILNTDNSSTIDTLEQVPFEAVPSAKEMTKATASLMIFAYLHAYLRHPEACQSYRNVAQECDHTCLLQCLQIHREYPLSEHISQIHL